MVLLTGLYQDPDSHRRGELLECLERNVQADRLDEIHAFVEDELDPREALASQPILASAKIRWIGHGRRVTYRDLFTYANELLIDRSVIIANADIFFDHTLARLDGYDLSGKLLCLSRWDVQPGGPAIFFDHPDSQDAWIFKAPIRTFYCDFHLGLPGCDNRLAWEAESAGLVVSNPGRSLRSHHLHLSGVRRYHEQHRLAGPTRSVPAGFLGAAWLWFVVPCMGRLGDLRQTMASLLKQPRSSYVLVDYSCPDSAGRWALENFPRVTTVEVPDRVRFSGAEARNRGAGAVDHDGILCFLDADMEAADGFSESVLGSFEQGSFLVPDRDGPGFDSTVVCTKADFDRAQRFDETFLDWGEECMDLRASLGRLGLSQRTFPSSLLSHLGGHKLTADRFRVVKDPQLNGAIHSAYRRAKSAILDETGEDSISRAELLELYSAITRRRLRDSSQTSDLRCAAVAFRERMGYTVARLEIGISSHNNDPRPFSVIPELLIGRQFTQVVACCVSEVEIEFLTSGRLYVLVGNDWEGCVVAESWLSRTALREDIPMVQTGPGGAFEVWGLAGGKGERYVLPTQVMLVADQLVPMDALATCLVPAARGKEA